MLTGFALVSVPLLLAVVIAATKVRALSEESAALVRSGVETAHLTQQLFQQIASIERSAKLYQVLNDPGLTEVYRDSRERLLVILNNIETAAPDSARQKQIQELRQSLRRVDTALLARGTVAPELVRDKDAVVSSAFIAEMTAYYKDQGSSLFEALLDTYIKYGFFKEKLISITKKGKTGAEDIKAMMEKFRTNPPATLGGSKVVTLKDYERRVETDLVNKITKAIELPESDVLQFITEDGSIISARPSGTEPKIKFYCSVNGKLSSKEAYKETNQKLEEKIDAIIKDLGV